jgi:nitroreductase
MVGRLIKEVQKVQKRIVKNTLPKYFHKSGFLSSLYYLLFDKSFTREHKAVLTGKVKHLEEAQKEKANYFLLVRNTHRIEKGLLMKPRRAVFGKNYIGETIDSFEGVWKKEAWEQNPQMKWFHDVLNEYFESASSDPDIKKYQDRFIKAINGFKVTSGQSNKSIPYSRLESNKSPVTYDDFYQLTKQRRSVRWFIDKPVSRELIDKAILAANQAPSACNRQPFEFRVFDDPELVKELVNYPMGTAGYGHSIPVMIVLVGNLDAYFDERDRHVIYIDASLASMTLMLALETLGLSSCAINWPDIEEREVRMEKFLKLGKYQRPLMCIGLGYPDNSGLVAFSEKRPLNQIRKYNL